MAPSPTAAATRFVDPWRTSRLRTTPGRLSRAPACPGRAATRAAACPPSSRSGPVRMNPARSSSTPASAAHPVRGCPPMHRKSARPGRARVQPGPSIVTGRAPCRMQLRAPRAAADVDQGMALDAFHQVCGHGLPSRRRAHELLHRAAALPRLRTACPAICPPPRRPRRRRRTAPPRCGPLRSRRRGRAAPRLPRRRGGASPFPAPRCQRARSARALHRG